MKRIFGILFALALVLGLSLVATMPVAAATTYYVATTGSDGNDGSSGAPWLTIQYAVSQVGAGDTIMVAAGTYPEASETTITQDLIIIGADKTTTIIQPGVGFSGSYLFRVNGGNFNLSNVTIDGAGNLYGGVRFTSPGTGTLNNNIFKNITYSTYLGIGVVSYGNNVIISSNTFANIGRVGVWAGGNNVQVTGNTYTGKGAIDCLDYGIEVGYGGIATITDNTITNCLGIASSDGSTSAAILVTTFYGSGTAATITGNTLTGNTEGIAVGYDASDTSTVVAHYNDLSGNTANGIGTTAPTVDGTCNWWGATDGPGPVGLGSGVGVTANVNYTPWLTEAYAPQKGVAAPGGTAYFEPDQGSIEGLTAVPTPPNPPITLPYGMFNFTLCCFSGTDVTLNITLPGPVPVGTMWYKYNGGAWDALPIGDDDGDAFITVTLTDGDPIEDEDLTVNGQIVDQGGPGFEGGAVGWETYPVSKARVLLPWIALLAAVAAGLSLVMLRRHRVQT